MMRKLTTAIGVSATLALALLLTPASAFAGQRIHRNTCSNNCCNSVTVVQSNNSTVSNTVNVVQNTGGNEVEKNVSKDVQVTAGDVFSMVNIVNNVGFNFAFLH